MRQPYHDIVDIVKTIKNRSIYHKIKAGIGMVRWYYRSGAWMFLELIACIEANLKIFLVEATKERFDRLDASQAAQTAILNQILAVVTRPAAVTGKLRLEFGGVIREGENVQMKVPMNTNGITGTVTYKNDSGGPGVTDGPPLWTAEPPELVTLTPSADGATCNIDTLTLPAGEAVKSCVITAKADGDLSDGERLIILTGTLDIFDPAAGATMGEITFTLPA